VSLFRHPKSAYWWCRFTIGGRQVRESTGTKVRKDAEDYEHKLRARYWREAHLGEQHHTWKEARERWIRERPEKRSLERDERIFREYRELDPVGLRDFTTDMLADVRAARSAVVVNEKTGKRITPAAVNREFALIRSVLNRARTDWRWLEHVPNVPMATIEDADPRWLTRAQFLNLVKLLPKHTADMARFAVATGIRRGNITGLTWDRVDLKGRFAYVPGSQAKGKRGIPVPLNDEAVAVLKRWRGKHETHVFVFRGEPVYQVATRAWREAVKAAGFEGLRFHDLRHTWASWQAQAGTPLYALRELGGWASDQMVKKYAHLGPGDLAAFAARSMVRPKKAKV
jgi:integrase